MPWPPELSFPLPFAFPIPSPSISSLYARRSPRTARLSLIHVVSWFCYSQSQECPIHWACSDLQPRSGVAWLRRDGLPASLHLLEMFACLGRQGSALLCLRSVLTYPTKVLFSPESVLISSHSWDPCHHDSFGPSSSLAEAILCHEICL